MSRSVLKDTRGLKALILQSPAPSQDKLLGTLRKLGIAAQVLPFDRVEAGMLASVDLIFVDADEGIEPIFTENDTPDVPLIALIGSEAPSRLSRVVRARAASHIQKPIRTSGVFSAILLAINEHAQRKRIAQENENLRKRLAGRRVVVKAVLALMNRWGIDDDEAYKMLRTTAMEKRVPVEEAAERLLGASPCPLPPETRSNSSD